MSSLQKTFVEAWYDTEADEIILLQTVDRRYANFVVPALSSHGTTFYFPSELKSRLVYIGEC